MRDAVSSYNKHFFDYDCLLAIFILCLELCMFESILFKMCTCKGLLRGDVSAYVLNNV